MTEYEGFPTIYGKNSIEEKYSLCELKEKFTVYLERTDKRFCNENYRVYNNIGAFTSHVIDPVDVTLHEVIFDVGQKLKIDVDAEYDKLRCIAGKDLTFIEAKNLYDNLLADVIDSIYDTFLILYGRYIGSENLIICDSSSNDAHSVHGAHNARDLNGVKFSTHIIINGYYVSCSQQARIFTAKLLEYVKCKTIIDAGVNKRVQNFRIAGFSKKGRKKTIITNHNFAQTLITNIMGCVNVGVDLADSVNPISTLTSDDVDNVLKIINNGSGITTDHRFYKNIGSLFLFKRIKASVCEFCNREHTSDNTLLVTTREETVGPNVKYVMVYKQCRKNVGSSIKIGEFTSGATIGEVLSKSSTSEAYIKKCIGRDIVGMDKMLENCKQHVYSEPKLRPFELAETLVVHAPMKMGKTKALREHLDRCYAGGGIKAPVIRFVSFRQTFSSNIKEKFADFTLYSDVKGPLVQDKLIVQVESLHRLEIIPGSEPPDLLILDECESIFEQFDSGLLKSFSNAFAKFEYLMRYSKRVICMDANCTDRTYRILQKMRPNFEATLYHHCTWQNAKQDKYYITSDKIKWVYLLNSCVSAGEKIAIPISSLQEGKIIYEDLRKRFPRLRIHLYSSETLPSEKKEHFADVNKYWALYDVCIYTPTVSAGVSFEVPHYAKIFGYFTDQSCNVETCIQMMGRVRNVGDNEYYICLRSTGNNLPTEIGQIRDSIVNRRMNLVRDYDETGLVMQYDANGEINVQLTQYFHVWCENVRIKNLSKNYFAGRFIDIIKVSGAQIEHLTDQLFEQMAGISLYCDGALNEDIACILSDHKDIRVDIRESNETAIAEAAELDELTLEKLLNDQRNQADMTTADKRALDKYRIRAAYRYDGNIDKNFVHKYGNRKTIRIYKNITRIATYFEYLKSSPPELAIKRALDQIQGDEKANYMYVVSQGEDEQNNDLHRKYVYDQHRYTIGVLKLCGWNSPFDQRYLHATTLSDNLKKNAKVFQDTLPGLCNEFGIKAPNIKTSDANANTQQYIDIVNKVLGIMYGGSIVGKNDMYMIKQIEIFTLDPDVCKAKSIPLVIPGPIKN